MRSRWWASSPSSSRWSPSACVVTRSSPSATRACTKRWPSRTPKRSEAKEHMAHQEPEHGHGGHAAPGHGPMVEYDHPPTKTMFVWLVVLGLIVLGTVFGVVEYFRINAEAETS